MKDTVDGINEAAWDKAMTQDTSKDWTLLEDPYEIIDAPMWWHLQGRSETASGYGRKLNSGRMVKLPDGRTRRMYVTQFSNAGTAWILLDGVRRIVR